jgi:hypothetical protein
MSAALARRFRSGDRSGIRPGADGESCEEIAFGVGPEERLLNAEKETQFVHRVRLAAAVRSKDECIPNAGGIACVRRHRRTRRSALSGIRQCSSGLHSWISSFGLEFDYGQILPQPGSISDALPQRHQLTEVIRIMISHQ